MTSALVGGGLIGVAVSLMLIFNGRVTGISGILSGTLPPLKNDFSWRAFFLLGLLTGGFILRFFYPYAFISLSKNMTLFDYGFAGFLVGFGTLLGNGCTSGHGVCGISRLSIRSIFATLIFILFGVLSVFIFKKIRGEI